MAPRDDFQPPCLAATAVIWGARRQASRQDFGLPSVTVRRLQVLALDAVARGLLEAVAAVEDLRLDVPDSPDVVATFVSRAIVDDVLPPSFVDSIPAGARDAVLVNASCA